MNTLIKLSENSAGTLQIIEKDGIQKNAESVQHWYTIEELAALCGFTDSHTMQSNPNILELLNKFSNSNDVKKGGYHNLRCFYSENVLKALKQYQLRNSVPKALKLPYGNIKLFERLRAEGILNSDNSPKQEQIDAARFKVVVKFINEKVGNKTVTLVTGKGLIYLARKLNTEIDHSVKADM